MKNLSISILKVEDEDIEQYFKLLNEAIRSIEELALNVTIHFDVMDNRFVPNCGIDIEKIKKVVENNFYVDTHLMVEDPIEDSYIAKSIAYGSNDITVHLEISDFDKVLKYLFEEKQNLNNKLKIGVAISPNTDIKKIEKYIDFIDKVLIMSVEPGYGGQKYLDIATDKIEYIKNNYPNIFVQVDGGINEDTLKTVLKAGADSFVIGSYLTDNIDELEIRLKTLNNIVKNS